MNVLNHIASSSLANIMPMASNADLNIIERLMLSARSSDYAGSHDLAYMVVFWLSVAFFIVVMGPYAYFIVKYRRKPGVPAQRSVSHNTPLELAWSIFPLLLLCVLFFMGFEIFLSGQIAPANAETINVRGKKWSWSLAYENGAATSKYVDLVGVDVPVYAIPANRPIRLVMDSEDVIHSFYVPDFRKKIDVFPNRYSTMWFEASEKGKSHYVFCAEYCGDQHSQMAAIFEVYDAGEYEQWKTNNVIKLGDMFPADAGKQLSLAQGCVTCHSVDPQKSANTGPPWWDLWDSTHEIEGGGSVTVDENYVRESIYEPAVKIVKGYPNQMNSFQGLISPEEITMIIAYMKTLSDEGQAAYAADKAAWQAAQDAGAEVESETPEAATEQ